MTAKRLCLRLRRRVKHPADFATQQIIYLDTTVHTLQQVKEALDAALERGTPVKFLREYTGPDPKPAEPWMPVVRPQAWVEIDPKDYTIDQRGQKGSLSIMQEDHPEMED